MIPGFVHHLAHKLWSCNLGLDVEDLYQVGAMECLKAIPSFRGHKASLNTYLYLRAKWAIHDAIRKWKHSRNPVQFEPLEPEHENLYYTSQNTDVIDVWETVASTESLSDLSKQRLMMYYQNGMTMQEVGAATGVGTAAVSRMFQRAYQEIRDYHGITIF